jgi:DNA transformation protein
MLNIGIVLSAKLNQVGIKSMLQLMEFGAEAAFLRLQAIDSTICINTLYALEGAIQGIRWHNLPKARKEELLHFFNQTKALK